MKSATFFRFNHLLSTVIVLITVTLVSCQSGRIPCPEAKYARLKKSSARSTLVYTAKAEQATDNSYGKPKTTRAVSNVTVEEWDCPRPGEKKYLPKSIRENIRKNYKKIKQQEAETNSSN